MNVSIRLRKTICTRRKVGTRKLHTRTIYIRNGMNSQFISCRKGRKIKHEDNWQYSSRASTHSSLRSIVMRLRINQILFEHIFNLVYFSVRKISESQFDTRTRKVHVINIYIILMCGACKIYIIKYVTTHTHTFIS